MKNINSNLELENSSSSLSSSSSSLNNQKSSGRNIRLKRKELAQLLFDYLEELILLSSRYKIESTNNLEIESSTKLPSLNLIREELENKQIITFTEEEIEHFCYQLKDQVKIIIVTILLFL